MSQYSSQNVLNMSLSRRGDPTTGGSFRYTRSEFVQGGGNGYDHYMDGYNTLPKSSVGGMAVDTIGRMSSTTGGGISGLNDIHQRAMSLQAQCQEDLRRAEFALQSGGNMADAEQYLLRAKDTIDQLKTYAMDLKQMGQPSDNVFRTWEICNDQLKGFHLAMTGSLQRRKSARGSTSSWEEQGRSFHDAVAWIAQQKRLIETTFWGEDPASIEKNLISHQRFHNSIQNSAEVDRARSELVKKGDKGNLHALDQEWDSLQQMSFARTQQLEDLQQIIQELSKEIMWVNDKEEEELIFDWGDKNLDQYIPRKQESYSKLMSALEEKEKQLNKLKVRVDSLLKNNHPASDKIEAYRDTLQTQWSWLLQITKCIDVHLKENAAYNQFFKEAHETCRSLQGQQEAILQRFSCDKNTSLENLLELLKGLERERETINDHKRQVQHLVNKSKSIVRLKARNPEERSSRPVIVKALCDFKRDQRVICKGDEAILKDNSQRSKWEVTGPGGLDMVVPSVCLILPPPNPLSINLATKNEQYYESILSIWNQLYINVKSLIAWQYCLIDIQHINSLTISMLAQMSPEEYSQLIKRLETHYEEFKLSCQGSQMFVENDKRSIENLFNGAQAHYGTLVVQLPAYQAQQAQQQLIIMTTAANDDARKLEEENQRTELKKVKKEVVKVIRTEPTKKKVTPSSHSLTELHALRLKLEAVEGLLNQHVHFCLGDDGTKDCGLKITQLEGVQLEVNTIKEEYVILRENIMKELERMKDSDKAQFLRNELGVINERFNSLESNSSTNLHRLQALKDLMESMARAEDIIKVHEARLTEKETTSLLPGDVNDYLTALKNIQDELDQKNDVLASLEAELAKANHWNGEVGGPFHRCDMILSKYSEQVGLLLDRWRRIKAQINCRLQDLQRYLPQLEQYKQSSSSFTDWMDDTRKKQDYLQATNIQTVQSLTDQINNQKAINAEIKAKRETLESVLKDNEACVSSIKDFESDLACYTSGLETLLNIPIKRTMLRSPSVDLIQEATQLQTRYMELLTWSDDHLKFLGELLKNMEDLKIRSTRIDLLEEELRLLRETIEDRNSKNKSLEEAILRYQLELSQSQEKLLSMEEIKQTTDLQCNAAKDSLDSTHNQLADLTDQVTHLNYLLEEEKRKRKLAEERFTQQQEEYQSVLKKRHTELESVSRSKVEVEKTMANQEHGIKQLQRKLEEETSKVTELRNEISKTSTTILSLQSQYSDIVKERDALQLKLQLSGNDKDHLERLEEELRRIKLSLESELQNRQRVQEENERVKRDLSYWKEQYESKQELVNKYDANKEHLESENTSLKSEIERLLRKLSDLESTYQGKLSGLQKELTELIIVKQTMQDELKKTREPSTLNASTIIFDGVRKTVTAAQLLDCGILDEPTYNQLIKGQKTVPDVSNNIKVSLKGTGPIAGVIVEKLQDDRFISGIPCKISLTEAKKECLLPPEVVDLLLDAQAATGHIIDPRTNQNLTVEEAVADGVVDSRDQDRLLAAQAAAVGYKHPSKATPLSVCEALKNGMIDMKTGLRLLQAQECVGGILDPNLSVFLPKVMAINRNILDENLFHSLTLNPKCYIDPETDQDVSYGLLKQRCKTEAHTGLLLLPVTERKDASKLIFDGVRKPVTAQQLHDCGVLDKFSLNQLTKGQKTVPQLSDDLKVFLKGIGPIAGVTVGSLGTISISEAKRQLLMSPLSADLLLDAQAATGHIIDPSTNQRFTVEEACARGLVDTKDRDRLIVAESAAVGYRDPNSAIPLSIFEAMNKGLVDRKTGLRLLQAQASAGGILDPIQSVFLPTDTAMNRNLLDEDLCNVLNRNTECYLDPDTEWDVSYEALKKKCKTDFKTGLLILPINERKDPSKLMFEGVRKSVSAKHLFECGVLDKRTFDQLVKGEKTVSEVSAEKVVNLKGTGPIAGVQAGHQGNISLSEAKKQRLLTPVTADLLLEAQAATGYIIDPITHQKLTVNEACAKGVVDIKDRDNLLAAEAAAIGYKDPSTDKLLSVYEAMKRGLVDWKTCLRFLQAQDCVGGIIDPNFGVFLPKDIAIKRNLLDEDLHNSLSLNPTYYLNPEPELDISYGALKQKCKTEFHTGLQILPISEKMDPSNVIFEGVRRSVTAQQLFDSGILDEPTLNQLLKGEKTVGELSVEKQVYLKGTGVIAGVAAGSLKKMSFTEAKKQSIMSPESADLLLEAQAATGHIIDPLTNQKLTVKEACARGVVSREDESKLFAAEAAAIGYRDLDTSMILSVGQAMKRGLIDKETALRLLQAQESAGGILHPVLSVYLPRDVAIDRNLIDKELYEALSQYPQCYLDPDTQLPVSYLSLKQRCREDISTGLLLLPEPKKPTTVQGLRSQVSVTDLLNAKLLEPSDIDQLKEGRLTSQDIEHRLRSYLGRSTCIAGLFDETSDKVMTFYEAMKNGLLRPETALELLEAQAASGFIVDPVKNVHLTVSDAYNKGLFGSEYLDTLLSAERAVTGYKLPGTGKVISLFQAIKRGLVAKEQGIRLLQAQIASGGIIDPEHSHRIDVNVAYSKGHLDEEMNKIVMDQDVASKVFSDPKTEEKLNYSDLKKRCITNGKTGLLLLPIVDKEKQEATMKNTLRKRRVIIVDPQTNKEMTIREAYDKGYIDHTTYLELAEQECEWEEITTTAPDGSKRFVIIDKKTGREYDISELLEKRVIDQSLLDQYRARKITLTQFADVITEKTEHRWPTSTSTSHASLTASTSSSSTVISRSTSLTKVSTTMPPTIKEQSFTSSTGSQDSSETFNKTSSVSITLTPVESVSEKYPVGAIFDTETLEKISVMAALNCGLLDAITAQRLLEAQACTGGIINPENGRRLSIQEASRKGIINDDMAAKLKPAQKAFIGYEDLKMGKKMSAAEAVKEMWLPYEAGQRFMEFQFVTGGLYDPELGCRRTTADALKMGWIDNSTAMKLQDFRQHPRILTCPKSKLKISYKEALDNCMVEESTGLRMLPASSVSSRGISSPYNFGSAPGSITGSRSGSRRSSRRSSLDLGSASSLSTSHHSHSSLASFSTRSETNQK
ncbi:desmoplakin-A-like isoform X2 [Corythoichthys intestinalis]|uniref:desmoplakin-A-like isoform X2 n=1 Tax=Corythoichthys intestinalis TaxID=161448 RepID=UPI0025A5DEE3|nr:desmoplakin-A-like isoform X2 [Corythoichthys intestinalis]